jgi:hypothetical protein
MVNDSISRRRFIGATAAAGAGIVLAQSGGILAQPAPAGNRLNIALIGFGAEGRVLLESLIKIDGIQIVAICDIWDITE